MTRAREADYSETYLLPPSIEDWVSADHPARFIRDVVELLDLKQLGFREERLEAGRPHYGSKVLLSAWVYGNFLGLRSSRQLERACRNDVGMIWLVGCQEPDHNTLWRFWRRHRVALRRLFSQVVKLALQLELVGFVVQALDGTKLGGELSQRRAWRRAELLAQLAKVEGAIAELMQLIDSGGSNAGEAPSCLPPELVAAEARRERLRESLCSLAEAGRDSMHPHDPEAVPVPCKDSVEWGYNAQVVVDGQVGVIVAQDVVNESNDDHQLGPMLARVAAEHGRTAEVTLADCGYSGSAMLAAAEAQGAEVLAPLSSHQVPRPTERPFHASRFRWDRARDCCWCPLGACLDYLQSKRNKQGEMVRVYRCRSGQYCPHQAACTRARRGRDVEISPYREALLRHAAKLRQRSHQELLRQRGSIVEIAFARIKRLQQFTRWTVRGLENVRTQWALVCTAYNLKRLLGSWHSGNWPADLKQRLASTALGLSSVAAG